MTRGERGEKEVSVRGSLQTILCNGQVSSGPLDLGVINGWECFGQKQGRLSGLAGQKDMDRAWKGLGRKVVDWGAKNLAQIRFEKTLTTLFSFFSVIDN